MPIFSQWFEGEFVPKVKKQLIHRVYKQKLSYSWIMPQPIQAFKYHRGNNPANGSRGIGGLLKEDTK